MAKVCGPQADTKNRNFSTIVFKGFQMQFEFTMDEKFNMSLFASFIPYQMFSYYRLEYKISKRNRTRN